MSITLHRSGLAERLAHDVRARGFAAASLAGTAGLSCAKLAAAWEDLPVDPYLDPRFGRRERRYAAFELDTRTGVTRALAGAAHVQAPEHNRLFGGLERRFAPIRAERLARPPFRALLGVARALLSALEGGPATYRSELHLMRVVPGARGAEPTPEGIHRDGRDWVFVLLVGRRAVRGGRLVVLDGEGERTLATFPMLRPLDLVVLDDRRVRHVATRVTGAGERDALVATFERVERA